MTSSAPPVRRRGPLVVLAALVLIVAGAAPASAAPVGWPAPPGRWEHPLLPPTRVVAPADLPAADWLPGHRGVDLAGGGTAVAAVADGTVVFAGPVAGRPVVSIDHGGGLVSSYDPVAPSVAAGQRVVRGQVVGSLDPEHLAASHCAPVLCLHLGARRDGVYIDPMLLLGPPRPSVLKPWGGLTRP
jgi:murein DD-endopeptidase MepM/ murein hydrolase activator NlpD